MTIKQKKIAIAFIFTIIALTLIRTIVLKEDIRDRIIKFQKETVPQFDSLQNQMDRENSFQQRMLALISANQLELAQQIVDSLMLAAPNNGQTHLYQGMIFYSKNLFNEAIKEYNEAINIYHGENPALLSKRAEAYIKLSQNTSALNDYRKAAFLNEDFNYELGKTFELIQQPDSAVIYYKKYLSMYPQKKDLYFHVEKLIREKIRNSKN